MTRLRQCWRKRATKLSWQAASLLLPLILSLSAWAQLYEYRDSSGRRVFVDRLSAVPLKYRDQLILREAYRSSPQQRAEVERLQQISQLEVALRRIDRLLASASSPISFNNNQVVVPVEIGRGSRSRTLNLLLDTGANRTVFHRQALAGLISDDRLVGGARTASGEEIPLYQARVDRLQIGPFEITPAQVQLLEFRGSSPHQGLLGMDLLSQVEYQLDLERETLTWAPDQIVELEAERQRLTDRLAVLRQPADLRSQSELEP